MLTLAQLIKITPLEEDVKQEALTKLPQMTETQKFDFQQVCWETINNVLKSRMATKLEDAIRDAAKNGIEEAIDTKVIEDAVINEFVKGMEAVTTEEQITELTQALKGQVAQAPAPAAPAPTTVN